METIDRARRIELLRRWSRLMDSAYRVPGTAIRFGWDPIIGLIPGVGDVATSSFAVAILYHAYRLGVPRVVLARMVLNTLVDLAAGLVPFAGDVADIAWKSNSREPRAPRAARTARREAVERRLGGGAARDGRHRRRARAGAACRWR